MRLLKKYTVFVFAIFGSCVLSIAQDAEDTIHKRFDVSGYVSYLQSGVLDKEWILNNYLHNRLNVDFYVAKNVFFYSAIRTRFIYGDNNRYVPNYDSLFDYDEGYTDLTYVPVSENSWLLTSTIDRFYGEYTFKKIQVSAGRQRINWGQCVVWNPNDIFNTYSYFDQDYPERAGSDALRLMYYRNYASYLDCAVKINAHDSLTFAGLYKFNIFNYDVQLFGGVFEQTDYTCGAGTMGYVGANSIRAEVTYLYPMKNNQELPRSMLFSVGADRMSVNELFIRGEFLYCSNADKFSIAAVNEMYTRPATIRQLSYDRYSLLLGVQYPVTPLFAVEASGICYGLSHAYFISPLLKYSLKENLEISVLGQYFSVPDAGGEETFAMLSWILKLSF